MVQLFAHSLLIIVIYRNYKLFFGTWFSWYLIVMSWVGWGCLFTSIGATNFWLVCWFSKTNVSSLIYWSSQFMVTFIFLFTLIIWEAYYIPYSEYYKILACVKYGFAIAYGFQRRISSKLLLNNLYYYSWYYTQVWNLFANMFNYIYNFLVFFFFIIYILIFFRLLVYDEDHLYYICDAWRNITFSSNYFLLYILFLYIILKIIFFCLILLFTLTGIKLNYWGIYLRYITIDKKLKRPKFFYFLDKKCAGTRICRIFFYLYFFDYPLNWQNWYIFEIDKYNLNYVSIKFILWFRLSFYFYIRTEIIKWIFVKPTEFHLGYRYFMLDNLEDYGYMLRYRCYKRYIYVLEKI